MIGFIRNEQEFEPQNDEDQHLEQLDFERMWDEGLTSTSVEARTARSTMHRLGR